MSPVFSIYPEIPLSLCQSVNTKKSAYYYTVEIWKEKS